jgi:transcriptional regulator with XRE-family HTH domain
MASVMTSAEVNLGHHWRRERVVAYWLVRGMIGGVMDFGTLMRDLMRERDLTGRGLARRVPCDPALISRLASGLKQPSARMASRIDEVLGAGGALIEASKMAPRTAAHPAQIWWPAEEWGDDEDVDRRQMLTVMLTGPAAFELERIRRRLDGVSLGSASERDADEWEQVAADYARQVYLSPAARYLPHLIADASEITDRVISSTGNIRHRLLRSTALIAALTAVGLDAIGDQRSAARWWRTSNRVASESGDSSLAALILGKQAVLTLYGPGGGTEALRRADQAIAVADGRTCSGVASAHKARAQAYASVGRHDDALAALTEFERVWEQLPDTDINVVDSEWGLPERRLRYAKSWVRTQSGDSRAALKAQESALAIYPTSGIGRTQVEMHRVETLIRAGDIDAGAQYCSTVLTALPQEWHRDERIIWSTRTALGAVPPALSSRRAVREAREALATPAPQR